MIKKRLKKEIQVLEDESLYISHDESHDRYTVVASILGPEETPFAGGVYTFEFDINLTTYPFQPPEVSLKTPIFHPNFSNDRICVDTLSDNWSSTHTLLSILVSLQSLLSDPNPDSPLDREAADMFNEDYDKYVETNQELIKTSTK